MSRNPDTGRSYAVTYLSEGADWSRALVAASDRETLRAVVAGWMPYVPDALAVVEGMTLAGFVRWREGLAMERRGKFAGKPFAKEFGALLIPVMFIRATALASRAKVPLGTALIRLEDVGE